MTNSLLLRSVIMYAVCALIAIFIGYHISTWDQMTSFGMLITVLLLMMVPFLLKWHHFWLMVAWNTTAMVFFLPGRPSLMLTMAAVSLTVSLIEHGIKQEAPFISARIVFWPMVFLTCVVLATAKLTGGIGLGIAGSANVGGKRYIWMLGAVAGYFALTSQRIPPEKVLRYATAFVISPVTSLISDISLLLPPSAVYYIFLIFPSTGILETQTLADPGQQIERFAGTSAACSAVAFAMLARYGLRGIFNGGKLWRPVAFFVLFVLSMFGGFRGTLVTFLVTCAVLFFLEGLHNSRLMPVLVCGIVLAFVAAIPLGEHLPLSVQRTLTVVPFLKLSDAAEQSAKASSEWRLQMWHDVLPEIPPHLLLGKGLSINAAEMEKMQDVSAGDEGVEGAKLAGDYHSGPLSTIIPFGIAGVIALLWLMGAGLKLLHCNHKYGDPAFQEINTYLLAAFIAKIIFFLGVFGSFSGDLVGFTGLLGVSVAINGGMRQPVRVPGRRVSDAWKVTNPRAAALN